MERGEKRRWAAAVAGAGLFGLLALIAFREPRSELAVKQSGETKRAVTLVAPGDNAVNDEAMLLDPTPLFLPTRWNATQRAVAPREAGGRFQGFDAPRYSFSESELRLGLPAAIGVPAGASEVVAADALGIALVGLGATERIAAALPMRGGFVEVAVAGTGRTVLRHAIQVALPIKSAWQPLEFLVGLNSAGLVGPLVLTAKSGAEEVDLFFANYLVQTLRVGERLAPGFYRISVGP